ncbi:hypothetical protein ACTXT7_016109, partial [Hymenolepis weldensis]
PSICPARSPRGLETEIQLLRQQVEEFRALSAKQERERLQQANEIERLAEEVSRNIKLDPGVSFWDYTVTLS